MKGFILALLLALVSTVAFAQLPETSTANLIGDATYTSSTFAVGRSAYIVVFVKASHNSATDGVKIDQSTDTDCATASSPTFQYTSDWSYTATDGNVYVAQAVGKCFRARYVNGATGQSSFDFTVNLWGGTS